jgi:phosphoglycolate phosphatase-like HAD superfamily hydrolase
MGRIGCLILDLDGTVIDSHDYTFAAFRHACSPFRDPPDDEEIYERFGPDEPVILRDLVGERAVAAACERLHQYYAKHVADVRVHPEIPALLATCQRNGVARGLFTGRGRMSTLLLLRGLRLMQSFDAVVAGDDAAPKPAGDGIALLLERLRRKREESLVVGDSPLDLQAAAAVGVEARLATWFTRGARHAEGSLRCIARPAAITRYLSRRGRT